MWLEQWVACAKQLNQWDTLCEFGASTDNVTLHMDCLWRLSDWEGLKQQLHTNKTSLEASPQVSHQTLLGLGSFSSW